MTPEERARKVEVEIERATFAGAACVWESVALLIRSGTPVEGLLVMATQNAKALKDLASR